MAEYDPQILQKFADRLYSQAATEIASCTVLGFLVGAVAGYALAKVAAGTVANDYVGACALVVGLIAALVGVLIGRGRAFHLKLEAQRTLCQLQTEKNTRPKP
jgi:uncharacterized membrane protein (Fun14 family)